MTDRDAILRGVLLSPADDLPRLVYADYLDEHGDADRAALIRWQVATGAEFVRLNGKWQRSGVRADAVPPECWRAVNGFLSDAWDGPFVVGRGFVRRVVMPAAVFVRRAAELFASHPLTAVVLTDKEPLDDRGVEGYFGGDPDSPPQNWYWMPTDDADRRPVRWELPRSLYDMLPKKGREVGANGGVEEAHESLSDACVAFGRSLAGLPPLPG